MSQLPIVRSVAALASVFAEYGSGARTQEAKEIPLVRESKLSSEQLSILSDYVVNHVWQGWVDPNIEGVLEELAGLKIASSQDVIFQTVGDIGYTATRNKANRPKSDSRIKPITKEGTYSNLMMRGRWVSLTLDPLAFDWNGQIQTAQHRIDAMLVARNNGAKLPLVLVTVGLPPQVRDMTDKAKSRTKKDDNFVDLTILQSELVRLVQLRESGVEDESGKAREKSRKDLVSIYQKAAGIVYSRSKGKDISPTGDKLSVDDQFETVERFGFIELDDFESETATQAGGEYPAFDYLVCKVYEAARGQSGKIDREWATEYFSPAIVVGGLCLASSDQTWLDSQLSKLVREDNETVEEFAERRNAEELRLKAPKSSLAIDFELVDKVLHLLKTSVAGSDSGLGTVFQQLSDSKKSEKKGTEGKKYLYSPMSIAAMSAFVQLVKNIRTGDLTSSVFTKYVKKNDKYSEQYRCFGGVDIGYTQTKRGKNSDE